METPVSDPHLRLVEAMRSQYKPIRWWHLRRKLKRRKRRKALDELTRMSQDLPGGYR